MPTVSVVVPCFNQGQFLDQAVQSVLDQGYRDFEIIVVDDGSTEPQSLRILENYERPQTRVLRTENRGLPLARNEGIRQATGKYILPLDADDKIHPAYLERAVRLLEANDNLGIVYPKVEFFGELQGVWELPPPRLPEILLGNVMVCSSFFRRADWQSVGGYNPNMKYGYEDLDLWLSIIALGREVATIPEVMFYYRRRLHHAAPHSSGDAPGSREKMLYTFTQLVRNHPGLYRENVEYLVRRNVELEFEKREFHQALARQVEELHATWSWRVTAPLRWLARWAGLRRG